MVVSSLRFSACGHQMFLCVPGAGDLWLACPADLTLFHSPYHALLLLSDEKSLLGELPLDCSPALVRVIKTTSAVKNLQQLAQDADLALLQVLPWEPRETPRIGKDRLGLGLGAPEQVTLGRR